MPPSSYPRDANDFFALTLSSQPALYQDQERSSQDHAMKSRDHMYNDILPEGDLILQALSGFLLILTCDGEVFYTLAHSRDLPGLSSVSKTTRTAKIPLEREREVIDGHPKLIPNRLKFCGARPLIRAYFLTSRPRNKSSAPRHPPRTSNQH
ncbi:aryl hydrocarbon receptor [Caerostris extrusa]|uniref:Aryl hydrocarbon receptor n=1 Tax=Caerostris extrusa TaxID=172846 RepID=A0AAV4R210_CAEEX|nr:aryl hydrocarbon receptor [Caerostris extrusa]